MLSSSVVPSMFAGRLNGAANEGGGVTGPRSIGVRELTYKMAFLASSVQVIPL